MTKRTHNLSLHTIALLTSTCWILPISAAQAQQTSAAQDNTADQEAEPGIADIVVTATRRETNLQTTARAVSAVSATDIKAAQVNTVLDLPQLVPSLSVTGQSTAEFSIGIRGVSSARQGPGGSTPVSVYLDGVILPQAFGQVFNFADVERIEVLRGPQGSLFGLNTTGGAVTVTTATPESEFGGGINARVGNLGTYNLNARLTGPLAEDLAFKAGLGYQHTDGWQRHYLTGKHLGGDDARSVDLGLRWQPGGGALVFDLRGDYSKTAIPTTVRITGISKSADVAPLQTGTEFDNSKYGLIQCDIHCGTIYSDSPNPQYSEAENKGIGLTTTLALSGVTIKSITAFRTFGQQHVLDTDGTELPLTGSFQHIWADQYSQELNFASTSSGRFQWLFGLFAYYQHIQNANSTVRNAGAILSTPILSDGDIKFRNYAAYLNLAYDVTDQLNIAIGGRLNTENKKFYRARGTVVEFDHLRVSSKSFEPRLDLSYKLTPQIFAYGSVAFGTKSPGFNFGTAVGLDPSYKREELLAYEGGLKATLFDRQLRLNIAAYHYDYRDLQTNVSFVPGQTRTLNAANAGITGQEVELVFRPRAVPGFSLTANAAHSVGKYKRFVIDGAPFRNVAGGAAQARSQCATQTGADPVTLDCVLTGNNLPIAPKWTASAIAAYDIETDIGTTTPRTSVTYRSHVFYSAFNSPGEETGQYAHWDGSLTWHPKDSKLTIGMYVRNITDEQHVSFANTFSPPKIPAANAPAGTPRILVRQTGDSASAAGVLVSRVSGPRTYGFELSYRF